MKKLIVAAAALLLATPALADRPTHSPGIDVSVARNSATVTQTAGAFAFSQIAQGTRAEIESPSSTPLVNVETGAFVMPYVSVGDIRTEAERGGRIYDPVGNVEINVDLGGHSGGGHH